MLSLIAITSVLGTISTNIKLRMPEFAMLTSVGMTPEGVRRMLSLESLFYGLKALIIGLPISFLGYYLLYLGMNLKIGFAFIWPWQSMLFSAAAVMLITFGTMRYSAKMLRGANTVELIRTINI
jgi:putative ABC transport system permease protein